MSQPKVDFRAKALEAWKAMPVWVAALAEQVNRSSQVAVARRLGISNSQVSGVLSATYKGDYRNIEQLVRGAFMGQKVECPVLGEIGRDQCRFEQGMGFTGASEMRAQLYRTCPTCPNATPKGHAHA